MAKEKAFDNESPAREYYLPGKIECCEYKEHN